MERKSRMRIISYLSVAQQNLLEKVGIQITDKDYTAEELEKMEEILVKYIREKCMDEKDEITTEGTRYEDLVDVISDLNYETNPDKLSLQEQLEEDTFIELKDGRLGTIVDITNEMYTVEIEERFKTGKIEEDIPIVSFLEIKRIVEKEEA